MDTESQAPRVVTYQFEIDDDDWAAWKDTVPRSKALDERIRELIAADTDGRVREAPRVEASAEQSERADTSRESGAVSRARDALATWDPADVDSAKARRAVAEVVGWLAQQDAPQQKADVLAWADGGVVEGYAASTLWDKVAQPGLRELVDAGVVEHRRNVGYEIVEKEA